MSIEYPITVKEILFGESEVLKPKLLFGGKCGDFVSVRPCDPKYGNKTYLGILIGELSLSPLVSWDKEKGALTISHAMHNPAIFVPDINAVVYGCGSWWGRIKSEADLKKITDADIENVWYVKALKHLSNLADLTSSVDKQEEKAKGHDEP